LHHIIECFAELGEARLCPIAMTTSTMLFGMMPLTLALGGLLSSILLTLVLVPVIYTYVESARHKLPARFKDVAWAAKLPFKAKPMV
jgi:HAE1 family hydrophobic/amphiphilic exporter-1